MPPCGCHAPLRVPCPLAGAMPPCGCHAPLRVLCPLAGAMPPCGCHAPLRVPCPLAGAMPGGQVIMPLDLVCNNLTLTLRFEAPCASKTPASILVAMGCSFTSCPGISCSGPLESLPYHYSGPEDVEQQEFLCFPRFHELFGMSLSNWLTPTVNRWYAPLTWQTAISLTRLTGPIAMAKYAWWCGAQTAACLR